MRFSSILAASVSLLAPLAAHAAPLMVKRLSVDPTSALVVQFAHLLEQLETEFYTQALAKFVPQDFIDAGISVPDIAITNFQEIQKHEASHIQTLSGVLDAIGASPITGCNFDFSHVLTDVATMAAVARVVELVGVSAYLGGANLIGEKNVLNGAAAILTTEARHQTFLNIIAGASPIPQPQDIALPPQDVLSIAGAFISGGCDLAAAGFPTPNPSLGINNPGAIVGGTQLDLQSAAINSTSGLFCQMMIGGEASTAGHVFPIDQCVVPSGLNGPVMVWVTSDDNPLQAAIATRDATTIVAGPTAFFVDNGDPLGALVRSNGSGFNSSQTLSPSEAQGQLSSATATTLFATTPTPTEANAVITAAPTLVTASAVPPIQVIGVTQIPASSA